jgi:uncharacterized membrane protein YuzA (DUF378 family)
VSRKKARPPRKAAPQKPAVTPPAADVSDVTPDESAVTDAADVTPDAAGATAYDFRGGEAVAVTGALAEPPDPDVTADPDVAPEEPVEFTAPEWDHSLLDLDVEPVNEAELKQLLRAWRRGRATKRLSQVLQDGYVAIFSVVLIVAMLGGAVFNAQANAAACESATCTIGRTLLPWVMLFAAFALTLVVARIFGPVVASAAEGFWLFDAPIRRGRLLRARLLAVLVAVAVGAAALGAILAALTGYPVSQILQWAAALGLGAAGLTAFAAYEQTFGRTWLTKLFQWVFGLAAFAALVAITGVATGWFTLNLDASHSTKIVVATAAAGTTLLVLAGALALLRLDQIHRARLVSGGNLISGMQGAAFAMDLGLMRDILVERDAMAKGQVRPTLGFGHGLTALVGREVQRLWRYPKRLVLWVVSLGVPYAVSALGLTRFNPFISALILLIAFVPLLGSLRVITRTRGLTRLFPFSNAKLRYASAAVAAILAVIWAILATPAFLGLVAAEQVAPGQAAAYALVTAAAGLLAGVRWVSAKPADYSTPMMQTGFGALPPGLMFNLFKGIDVVAVMTGPLLLGWSPYVSAIIGLVVVYLLSGSFDMSEAQQMQEEMKKERERLKAGGTGKPGGPKKVIAPPRR